MPEPAIEKGRNALLDVVRGASLLMVIISHFGLVPKWTGIPHHRIWGRTLDEINAGMGYYGVVMFFVISGFLITGNSLRRYPSLNQIDLSEFWWMRFARLVPMLILCAVAMCTCQIFALHSMRFLDGRHLAAAVTALFAFRFNEFIGRPDAPAAWNPLWSLSVEEMFYLVFPLVARCWNGVGAMVWTCLMVIATALYLKLRSMAGAYDAFGCMDLLGLGCILALLRPGRLRGAVSATTSTTLGVVAAVVGVGTLVFTVLIAGPLNEKWSPPLCAVGAAILLLSTQWLTSPTWLGWVLLPISTIGVVSYEAYLIHDPLREYLYYWGWTNDTLTALAVVAGGWLVHRYFSEPFNLALRQLRGFTRRPPRAEVPSWPSLWGRSAALIAAIVFAGYLVRHH
jgi:peptidoglycan/LPS O-acetylase OafA/YrhL